MTALKITKQFSFSKVGMNEIEGLKEVMTDLMLPVQKAVKEHVYWNDCALEEAEYKGCDGFIPHSHNCGGIQLNVVVPKCEEYDFSFLEFGEIEDSEVEGMTEEEREEYENSMDNEGHLDASLEIWLKFEGLNESTGELKFYLVLSGGNHDAPYFRNTPVIFETEFSAKTLAGVKLFGERKIKKLLNFMFHGVRA